MEQKQKTIYVYQCHICQIGGVETFLYNWCYELRNYYDITILYSSADPLQLERLQNLVKVVKYNPKETYTCDIFLRNSVWGYVPDNIISIEYNAIILIFCAFWRGYEKDRQAWKDRDSDRSAAKVRFHRRHKNRLSRHGRRNYGKGRWTLL